ncbi:hypothetical protein M405DRAFT_845034 [Rhizopogon salebrosus TDB-379]|nr:hypothetical protein M405DRAFT_845034 [Rhizopogon salebrosus TDB-379]
MPCRSFPRGALTAHVAETFVFTVGNTCIFNWGGRAGRANGAVIEGVLGRLRTRQADGGCIRASAGGAGGSGHSRRVMDCWEGAWGLEGRMKAHDSTRKALCLWVKEPILRGTCVLGSLPLLKAGSYVLARGGCYREDTFRRKEGKKTLKDSPLEGIFLLERSLAGGGAGGIGLFRQRGGSWDEHSERPRENACVVRHIDESELNTHNPIAVHCVELVDIRSCKTLREEKRNLKYKDSWLDQNIEWNAFV